MKTVLTKVFKDKPPHELKEIVKVVDKVVNATKTMDKLAVEIIDQTK
jgi:hypothetical protein